MRTLALVSWSRGNTRPWDLFNTTKTDWDMDLELESQMWIHQPILFITVIMLIKTHIYVCIRMQSEIWYVTYHHCDPWPQWCGNRHRDRSDSTNTAGIMVAPLENCFLSRDLEFQGQLVGLTVWRHFLMLNSSLIYFQQSYLVWDPQFEVILLCRDTGQSGVQCL